jgi:hypothetical protein
MDPLGFILRVRLRPPRAPETFEVLDGHGLWRLTLAPAVAVNDELGRALRLDGKAEPIFWDGRHDDDRPNRTFSFWLSDDSFHTPLRLVMPLAVGEVRADLVTVSRNHPLAVPIGGAAHALVLPRGSRPVWPRAAMRPQ